MANPFKADFIHPEVEHLSFPQRLHRHLHRSRNTENIVSFLHHGRAFRIHNETSFRNEVLPVWFDDLDWDGFLRQLQRYGFRQLVNPGPDQGAFYHEQFLRGQVLLLERMRESNRIPINYSPEPDFSRMPMMDFEEITNPFAPFIRVIAAANHMPWPPPDFVFDDLRPNAGLQDILQDYEDLQDGLDLADQLRVNAPPMEPNEPAPPRAGINPPTQVPAEDSDSEACQEEETKEEEESATEELPN